MVTHSSLLPFSLENRSALITGGGNGIGRAICKLFSTAGASVGIVDKNANAAAAAAAELQQCGSTARAYATDVSDEAAMERAIADFVTLFGRLDILINNAGLAIRQDAVRLSLDDWNRVVAVNLTGVFLGSRIAARYMTDAGGGAIVNTASVMGLSGGLFPNVAYQTTKGGVINMTRALAVEWAESNIRVNAVAPTYVDTNFIDGLRQQEGALETIINATPFKRLAMVDEVAAAVLFLASPAASMITGAILPVDGGFLAR